MPTPSGLPKVGEVWTRTSSLPPDWQPSVVTVKVLERGGGSYWSLRVEVLSYTVAGVVTPVPERQRVQLWVDASYWHSKGELVFARRAA